MPSRKPRTPSTRRESPKVSRTAKPEGLSLEEWQRQLRRQFGRQQDFRLKNVGGELAFSEFRVNNPQSRSNYRVTIRGTAPGDNRCTCPDFATNTLGTCKHIEFVLAKLERNKRARAELEAGYRPASSELFLRYGAQREVCFRPLADAPPALVKLAGRVFDPTGRLKPEALGELDDFVTAEREDAVEAKREFGGRPKPSPAEGGSSEHPWKAFLQAGSALLQQVAGKSANGPGSLIRQDPENGERYLGLPAPSEEVLADALKLLGRFLGGVRG